MSEVEEMNSAQISFAPLGRQDIDSLVEEVLEIIESSGMRHETGPMSTMMWGSPGELADIICKIQTKMNPETKYILDIRISNTCGCGNKEGECGE